MRAVAYLKPLPVEDAGSLVDIEVDRPSPSGKDLLVEVKAVSVNPVDTKRRRRDDEPRTPKILGYDAAGIVVATGAEAQLFRPEDAVYYAGASGRPGPTPSSISSTSGSSGASRVRLAFPRPRRCRSRR
jgi:NADPH2:quinone reductase